MEDFKIEEKLLLIEGSLASTILAEGLNCLRKADIYQKGMYYQAFFSLSIGIERLLKLIIIYDYRAKNSGKMPENRVIKEKGHNLYEMINIVAPKILENDLNKIIIRFLSEFAKYSRYYNLDTITGKSIQKINPLEEWNIIEKMILKEYKAKIKEIQNKKKFASYINQTSDILYLSMNLNQITDTLDIINEVEKRDIVQGYNVLVFYKIIRSLVYILTDYELQNNFFPNLREFFKYFKGNYTDGEIRRKKNWKNIITG